MCLLHNMQCKKNPKTLLTKVKGLELACSRKLRVDQFKYIVSILAHVSLYLHCLVSVSADQSSIRWTFLMMQTGLLSCSSNGSDGCCLHLLSSMAASAFSCGQWAHPPRSCTAEFDLGREWVLKFKGIIRAHYSYVCTVHASPLQRSYFCFVFDWLGHFIKKKEKKN